jgi:hypothetical protein
MYLQKVIYKKTREVFLVISWLMTKRAGSGFVSQSEVQIRGSGLVPKSHGSGTLVSLGIPAGNTGFGYWGYLGEGVRGGDMTLTTGSRSLLLGTSIQVISTAPGVPGEQGVSRSCSIILGSSRPGPNSTKIRL